MRKLFTAVILLLTVYSNAKTQNTPSDTSTTVFHKPSEYKPSWQRLLLQLSTAFYTAAKENQVDLDSSLIYCAHSFGLSRLPIIAEGISAPDLTGKLKWIDDRDPKAGLRMLSTVTGKKHLELLVLLGAYYAFEPDSYHRNKDNVLYFLNNAVSESKMLHEPRLGLQARLLIGKMYVDGYDFQHGDPIFDQLIKDCQATDDHIMEVKVWFYRGLYTGFTLATTPKRIAYLQQARQLYHQQNNTEGEISALTDISYLNVPIYQMDKAYNASLEALRLAESIQFPFIHYNTDAVSMISTFQGKFGEPLRYSLETVRVAEAVHDSIGLGVFYNRVGVLYSNEDPKHKEAQKWLEKAIYTMVRTGNDNVLYLTLANLVYSLSASGNRDKAWSILLEVSKKIPPKTAVDKLNYNLVYSACYILSKNYDMAEKCAFRADSIERQLEKNGYSFRRAYVTEAVGDLYFFKDEYGKARIFYEKYLSDPSRAGSGLPSELYALDHLIKIDSIQKDNSSEVRHSRLYKKLADSNYVISKTRQAEELQVKYATEEKESQITLLNQKAKLEQANLNKVMLIRNVTIGGIILVMIIAGLLYRQSRLRKKSNEVITHKSELLERLLTEKEWLLKEVNHRVKNNLHMVISLLESQAIYLENDALEAMQSSKHRIFSMSLIHQKLYQTDDVKTIDMSVCLPELVNYLRDSFNAGNLIHFSLDVDPVQLSVAQAIPLALVLNEAITNSVKYAFPDNRRGEISIKMRQIGENIELAIRDNGVGMTKATEGFDHNSLGLKLMRGLIEEISGQIKFENNNGTTITITFKTDLLVELENGLDRKAV